MYTRRSFLRWAESTLKPPPRGRARNWAGECNVPTPNKRGLASSVASRRRPAFGMRGQAKRDPAWARSARCSKVHGRRKPSLAPFSTLVARTSSCTLGATQDGERPERNETSVKVRERHFIFLLTVIFGFNIALVFYAFGPHEPEYQKKRFGAWLEDLDYSRPSFRREAVPQAEDAVRQIGTDAVPCLIRMMRSYDSPLKKKLVALCSKQSFVRLNFGLPADKLQWRGALGIYVLGPAGKEAIPELMNLLTNQHAWIRGRAAMALGKIG